MIPRPLVTKQVLQAIGRNPITAILGPRQCGKTTLARALGSDLNATFIDLENPLDRSRLGNPLWALSQPQGLVIIDEVQLAPELFPILRVLADQSESSRKFLILGSASPILMKKASESLAGRIEFIEMTPFNLTEIASDIVPSLWLRGGYPRSLLSRSDKDSSAWREGFIRTFLERDIPQLGITISPIAMRRFWTMVSHYHGQIWNASEIGRSLGVSDKTVRSYLDILTGTFMIRQLQPWFENVSKRQVKSPKLYLRDSGLFHHLLGIDTMETLQSHPKLGASWEGFALETFLQLCKPREAYFWSTYSGAELDLFYVYQGKRFGVEVKFTSEPRLSKSMEQAKTTLCLEHLWILIPGTISWKLNAWVSVIGLEDLPNHPHMNEGI